MAREIRIIRGPSSATLQKQAAVTQLTKLPGFPEGAEYAVENIDGRWIAAVVIPEKTAGPFPPSGGEEAPAGPPAPEGPPTDGPPSGEEGPPKPEGEEKPKGEGEGKDKKPGEEGKVSLDAEVAQIKDMLTHMMDALGLSSPADGMIPGADAGPMGPPPGPPGLGGPPGAGANPSKPGVGVDNKMHTVHERSLKPGEAPPGTTPVGTPAFAKVQIPDDHPFADAIRVGQKEVELESEVGNAPIAEIATELRELAEPYGYFVEDIQPRFVGGSQLVTARIVRSG